MSTGIQQKEWIIPWASAKKFLELLGFGQKNGLKGLQEEKNPG